MKKLTSILAVVIAVQGIASAGITVYTGKGTGADAGWNTALAASTIYTIDWDDVLLSEGSSMIISGDSYSSMPGKPMLSVDSGSQLYVGNPDNPSGGFFGPDFYAVSGQNVFSPDSSGSPEGTLTIAFNKPVYALGAWFLDVEDDYATTGIRVAGTLYTFDKSQGDNTQSFLGIISTTSFLTAEIYMASALGGWNGVGIDDVKYALVPLPASILLGVFAVGLVGRKLRKFV